MHVPEAAWLLQYNLSEGVEKLAVCICSCDLMCAHCSIVCIIASCTQQEI